MMIKDLPTTLPEDCDLMQVPGGLLSIVEVGYVKLGTGYHLVASDDRRRYTIWKSSVNDWRLANHVRSLVIEAIRAAELLASTKAPRVL